jgi:ribosome biogenesis protein MAK21
VKKYQNVRSHNDLSKPPENDIHPLEEAAKSGKKQKKVPSQNSSASKHFKPPIDDTSKPQLPTKVSFNPKSHFVFKPTSQWYTAVHPLTPHASSTSTISPSQLASLTSKATELHTADSHTFQSSSSSNAASSEASFLFKIIQSGTLSDRLGALTLLVQSSPLHNTKALEALKGMAERGKGKGGRGESLKALRCIVDWWVGGGAPDRKLK